MAATFVQANLALTSRITSILLAELESLDREMTAVVEVLQHSTPTSRTTSGVAAHRRPLALARLCNNGEQHAVSRGTSNEPRWLAIRALLRRNPADVRDRLVGRTLHFPLGEGTHAVTISPRAQAIRFSLRADEPAEVKA